MSRWYYTPDSRQRLGPVTSEQLRQLALSGELLPQCMVTREGSGKWSPAADVKGLFPERAVATPAPLATLIVPCPWCRRGIPLQQHELSLTIQCAGCNMRFIPAQPPAPAESAGQKPPTAPARADALDSNAQLIGDIILIVTGLGLGLWAFARVISLVGQFHSWSPPFTDYEIKTFVIGGGAVICLTYGLTCLLWKKT
jgi:hypothetical protein